MRRWYGARNLTIPLSHDRSASLLGVDLAHHGLYCRFRGCNEHFLVGGAELPGRAGQLRDRHELEIHGYRHQRIGDGPWAFTQRFVRVGKREKQAAWRAAMKESHGG